MDHYEPYPPALPPQRPPRYWLHAALFLATVASTTYIGGFHAAGFESSFGSRPFELQPVWEHLQSGLWFSLPFIAFLTAHEFGHYFAARAHGLRPTLPFFIPMPLLFTGTMGAVIFFRGRFPNRRVLFDFAGAGPLAGFAVALPALVLGIAWSNVGRLPADLTGYFWLGEPLLFQWVVSAIFGPIGDGLSLNMHPTALAGWLGLLFTLMNLIPAGQLDGGHIAYALLGRRARWVTIASLAALALLVVFAAAYSWIGWLILLAILMRLFGWDHPPAVDDAQPLDPVRLAFVGLIVVIFIVCFTPVPISPIEFIGPR